MATITLSQPDPMKGKGNLRDNWSEWKQKFEVYLSAAGIDKNEDRAIALFKHTIGQYGLNIIYNELQIPEPHVLGDLFSKFDEHCNLKKNLTYDRYKFFNTKQENNQTFEKFLYTLKQKVKSCEFEQLTDSLIMTQLISGLADSSLREHLLRLPDLTLDKAVDECRRAESAQIQAQYMSSTTKQTQKVQKNVEPKHKWKGSKQPQAQSCDNDGKQNHWVFLNNKKKLPSEITNCHFCGNSHIYGKCPAFGSTCNKCHLPNHFAKMCRTDSKNYNKK